MVEQIDRDGSGTIEFQEFVEMMKKKMLEDKNVEVEIEKAFNYFDDDNEVITISIVRGQQIWRN